MTEQARREHMDDYGLTDFNGWCGLCVDRKAHRRHEDGAVQALHLERLHGYRFGPTDNPLGAPYALDRLHGELHRRTHRHEPVPEDSEGER